MSDSVRPHRRQPDRLLRPWDSPGKNTRVGCHFLLQCMKVKSESESEVVQSCPTLRDPMDCSLPGSSVHGIFQARVLNFYIFSKLCSSSTSHLPLYEAFSVLPSRNDFLFFSASHVSHIHFIYSISIPFGAYLQTSNIPRASPDVVACLMLACHV